MDMTNSEATPEETLTNVLGGVLNEIIEKRPDVWEGAYAQMSEQDRGKARLALRMLNRKK